MQNLKMLTTFQLVCVTAIISSFQLWIPASADDSLFTGSQDLLSLDNSKNVGTRNLASEENATETTIGRETSSEDAIKVQSIRTEDQSIFTSNGNFTENSDSYNETMWSISPKQQKTSEIEKTVEESTSTESLTTESGILEDTCKPDKCSNNSCIYTKPSGCIDLTRLDLDYDFSYVTFRVVMPRNTSVIFLRMIVDKTGLMLNTYKTIELLEPGRNNSIWTFEPGQEMGNRTHVSGGCEFILKLPADGNWTGITLHYEEIEFVNSTITNTSDRGKLTPALLKDGRYRPNTYMTYLLTPSHDQWNESSVMLTAEFIDLDETSDFLLIGPGKKLFSGSKPIFLTGERKKSTKYYIANEDAYIVFISRSSNMKRKGFEIKWERSGQLISKPEDDFEENAIPDYVLKSVQVCFYNASALPEFNRTEEEEAPFPLYRKKLAEIANQYSQEKNLRVFKLTEKSVVIYRVSQIEPSSEEFPEGVIYTMVAIVQSYNRKIAVFERDHLEEIMDRFDKDYGSSLLEFKVGHCSSRTDHLPWYIAAICLLILSTVSFVVIWIYSIIMKWRGRSGKEQRSSLMFCCPDPSNVSKENEYMKYSPRLGGPQVTVTSDTGNRIIVHRGNEFPRSGEVNFSDEESDGEIFNRNWMIRKRPSRGELKEVFYSKGNNTEPKALKTFSPPRPLSRAQNSNLLWTSLPKDELFDKEEEMVDRHIYVLLDPNHKDKYVEHEAESKL